MSGTNDYVDSTERRTEASGIWFSTLTSSPLECFPVILAQSNTHSGDFAKANRQNPRPPTTPIDLADHIKGMYRLLDLIVESGSNGYGK